jgi:MFS family permease
MAVSNVSLFGAAFLTPVFAGRITKAMGWQWCFYFVAIFLAAALPFMIVFVPETAYRRPDHLNTDFKHKVDRNQSTESHLPLDNTRNEPKVFVPGESVRRGTSRTEIFAQPNREKDSVLKSMRLFNGRKTDESFFKLLLRPFPLFLHPGVLYVSCSPAMVSLFFPWAMANNHRRVSSKASLSAGAYSWGLF